MGTLYIDKDNITLNYDNHTLVIYKDNQLLNRIPLMAINRIFIYGDIDISSRLMNNLADNKIGVIFLGGRNKDPKMFFHIPHNDAKIRINQYKCSLNNDFCIEFCQKLIQDKINSQIKLLSSYSVIYSTRKAEQDSIIQSLKESIVKVSSFLKKNQILGCEGSASALYFNGIKNIIPIDLLFKKRNRRPPKDPVNSMLSLGYTLLHYEIVLEIYARGLDPFIGFLHEIDFGRESLSCDIIEPLRYIIDDLVLKLVIEKGFRDELFYYEKNGACLMSKIARSIFYKEYSKIQEKIRFSLNEYLDLVVDIIKAREE